MTIAPSNIAPRPLVIYHDNCSDGFGAAFAVWLKIGPHADYVPLNYGFKLEDLPDATGRDVYIVDFSLPREMFEAVLSQAQFVYWFDHHKTAFEMWCPDIKVHQETTHVSTSRKHYINLDNARSGALLTYETLFLTDVAPDMFVYLDDYDRWQFKHADTKAFIKGLWAKRPWSFEQWANMYEDASALKELVSIGNILLDDHNLKVQTAVKYAAVPVTMPTSGGFTRGLAANVPSFMTSDVGHSLAEQSKTFGLLWVMDEEGPEAIKCSLRSVGDFDVSAMARQFGGGGHRNAAGFKTDIKTLCSWLKSQEPSAVSGEV